MLVPSTLLLCVAAARASWFTVDHTKPDLLGQQDEVYLQRKGKFIKFDAKDNEVEVELGISIPFLKIPILSEEHKGKHGYAEGGGVLESKDAVSINGPGVVIAGVLVLTSFFLVPLIFTKTSLPYIGRSADNDNNPIWNVLKSTEEMLWQANVDTKSCFNKGVCWISKSSKESRENSFGHVVDSWIGSWWMETLLKGTAMETAVAAGRSGGSCDVAYSHCPFTMKNIQRILSSLGNRSGH